MRTGLSMLNRPRINGRSNGSTGIHCHARFENTHSEAASDSASVDTPR